MNERRRFISWLALSTAAGSTRVHPATPLRIVVPYAAGGTTDVLGRAIALSMARSLDRTVIVENRTGASGLIAAQHVKASVPDGSTLFFTNNALVLIPLLQKVPAYDPLHDFAAVATVCRTVTFLAVHASVPAKSFAEFIIYAKRLPEGISAGNTGMSSAGYLQTLMFARESGIKILHVPYKGTQETANALTSGEVKMQLTALTESLMAQVRSGTVRLLAVAAPRRLPSAPELPTINELVPGYELSDGWFGLVTAAGCPSSTVERLNAAVRSSLEDPVVLARLRAVSLEPLVSTPTEYSRLIANALTNYRTVIARENLPIQ